MTFRCLSRWLLVAFLICCSLKSAFGQISPEAELKTLQTALGFDAQLFASEPMITNPTAIDVDTQGRVWVAEIQWYRGSAKQPPADKIKVLEDTDGDGRADKVTVFADGLLGPMSVCVAGDKVYVATSPDLWVYEDKNGDLKADGPPKKVLTGFGGVNHDHGAHSLVLGPDHKWWMAHGDTGIDVTGIDGSHIKSQWGAMLRGELDGSQLEAVAVNFRNPYEICVNSFGEAFCSDNDNDGLQSTRICWIMEGGNYGWFGGPPERPAPGTPFGEHWHFRGHVPGFVPATVMTGFGSPCGMCLYESDAFGPHYKNVPLHADAGPREVRAYPHAKHGYGMTGKSEVFLSNDGDNYFRPDDVCTGPDGRLYVSDWYDGGVGGHGYNDPDHGRIFLLTPTGKKLTRHEKPGPYANVPDAIEGLKSPNLATQYLARERLLTDRGASRPALEALLSDPEPNFRARALWMLDRIGGQARDVVVKQLGNSDPTYRALATRILRRHGAEYQDALLALVNDSAPEVRRELLLALPKLSGEKAEAAFVTLALAYDGQDRYQLEALNIAAGDNKDHKEKLYQRIKREGKLAGAQVSLLQLLSPDAAAQVFVANLKSVGDNEALGRTLLQSAGSFKSLEAGRAVLDLAGNPKAPPALRALALETLAANLPGNWSAMVQDEKLTAVLHDCLEKQELRGAGLALVRQFSLKALAKDVWAIAKDKNASPAEREQAISVGLGLRSDEASATLVGLLADTNPNVRQAALLGLCDLQDLRVIRDILGGDKYPAEMRKLAVEHLIESTGGALVLLRLIEEEKLPAPLKQFVIERAATHPDSIVRVFYEKFIPAEKRPKTLGESMKMEDILALKGDAKRGEEIFSRSSAAQCKNCHAVNGIGGNVGPDLSMIGKKYERRSLLETIFDPSKAIAPEYVPYMLTTHGGLIHVGFLVERNKKRVVIKDSKGTLIRVPAEDVDTLEDQKKSIMPDLVLRDITAQDAADLLEYLTTLRDGTVNVGSFRILGPFDMKDRTLDTALEPEATIGAPDLQKEYQGLDGKSVRWDVVAGDSGYAFPGINTAKYDEAKELRSEIVAHYLLAFVDSNSAQDVKLLVGSDDGCKVWVNGQVVHRYDQPRGLTFGEDKVQAKLKQGRNVVVIKVVNGTSSGGAALGIRGPAPVTLRTE